MDWQNKLTEVFQQRFEKAKQEDPKCSLRSFSRQIGVAASTASEILRGKTPVGRERAAELIECLDLDESERRLLLTLLNQDFEPSRERLQNANYEILSDWTYLAVLHFFDLDGIDPSPQAIAERLAVSESKIEQIIDNLVERGLLQKSAQGRLTSTGKSWATTDGPSRSIIRRHHKDALESATTALNIQPVDARDFTTMTLAGSSRQMELIRSEIRKLHKKVEALAEGGGPRDRIYRLLVGYFPLDHVDGEETPIEERG